MAKIYGMNYSERITLEPGKRSGKPCIRGTRMTVYDVLSYLAAGMSFEEIVDHRPDRSNLPFLACLAFAAAAEKQKLVLAA